MFGKFIRILFVAGPVLWGLIGLQPPPPRVPLAPHVSEGLWGGLSCKRLSLKLLVSAMYFTTYYAVDMFTSVLQVLFSAIFVLNF